MKTAFTVAYSYLAVMLIMVFIATNSVDIPQRRCNVVDGSVDTTWMRSSPCIVNGTVDCKKAVLVLNYEFECKSPIKLKDQ